MDGLQQLLRKASRDYQSASRSLSESGGGVSALSSEQSGVLVTRAPSEYCKSGAFLRVSRFGASAAKNAAPRWEVGGSCGKCNSRFFGKGFGCQDCRVGGR
ncbi:uncharacterized protein LOC117925275 isoform X1 [Vitis riparia]|uniref:uncharacterized protein LOC117925275 isoform X1 n=1 Tax=Vitis riparia TaxID=96939 RepID=UPI00155A4E65|nr:uncharacterized protein LOC117925275 isoform X1 [Vitis riparia]